MKSNASSQSLKRSAKNNRANARLRPARSTRDLTLKTQRVDGRKELAESRLLRFANPHPQRSYHIEFDCPEFTCICPVSGFPDFARIKIRYIPAKFCVELKSLKLYLNQYRDRGVFHEAVVNIILNDLLELLSPRWIEVEGDFNVRGNIKTIIKARHPDLPATTSQVSDCPPYPN